MAVTFTNNFKNILDQLESLLESEFKGSLPIYKGNSVPNGVNQALQLTPVGSTLLDYMTNSETREFSVSIKFLFNEININEKALDHILRQVSRIEALVHDNPTLTLADSTKAYNAMIGDLDFNVDKEEEYEDYFVVGWDLSCEHLSNFG